MRGRRWPFLLAFLAVLVLGVLPIAFVLLRAAGSGGTLSATLQAEATWVAARGTLELSVLTTLLAVALGVPLAWLTTRTDLPGRALFRALLTIPYIVPPYIAAMAWINLASPNVGWFNQVLGKGALNIYSMGGLVWVLALSFYPYVFLTVRAALQNADPSLEDAARMSGARTWRVLRDVSLPIMRPAILASAGLVFMVTASAFGAPALLGDAARLSFLSTHIYEEYLAGGPTGVDRVASLSCLLLVFALVPLVLRARHYATVSGKAAQPTRLPLGWARTPLTLGLTLFALLAIVLPALAIALTAFMRVEGDLSPANFTTANLDVLGRRDNLDAIGNSLLLAAGAATLAAVLGGLVAYYGTKTRVAGRRLLGALATLPLATPGTVLAIGLLLVWSGTVSLANTLWILLVAYVAKYVALATRPIREGLGTIDDALPEAARMSGARGLFLARTIWLPLARPAVVAGWFLVFVPCFSELTMSVLLRGPGVETVGTRLFDLSEYEAPTDANVLATVVLGLVLVSNTLLRIVSKGRYGV